MRDDYYADMAIDLKVDLSEYMSDARRDHISGQRSGGLQPSGRSKDFQCDKSVENFFFISMLILIAVEFCKIKLGD